MVKCKYDPKFVTKCMSVNSFPKYGVHTRCLDCLHFRPIVHCMKCDCYDPYRGCTMPESDRWYACSIESAREENRAALEKWLHELEQHKENIKNGKDT